MADLCLSMLRMSDSLTPSLLKRPPCSTSTRLSSTCAKGSQQKVSLNRFTMCAENLWLICSSGPHSDSGPPCCLSAPCTPRLIDAFVHLWSCLKDALGWSAHTHMLLDGGNKDAWHPCIPELVIAYGGVLPSAGKQYNPHQHHALNSSCP